MSEVPQMSREGVEFTMVSVSPNKGDAEAPAMRRLKALQQSSRESWLGLTLDFILPPLGLKQVPSELPLFQALEFKAAALLRELTPELGQTEYCLTFTAPSEGQIVKDSLPQSMYSKGNYVLGQDLLYRVYQTDAKLVRSVLELSGFSPTDSHDWNLLWANSSPKSYLYEGLNEHQRINHFPKSNEITRKDLLCANLVRMQAKYGREAFDFVPETFILPDEFSDFCSEFNSDPGSLWIVKPSASSQGRGIFLVDSLVDVPLDDDCIISRYISNPLLLNSLKFDLRIYVIVTCFDPLRIYVYQEGLTRFASEAYNPKTAGSRYMFLTNYSVNKKNANFVQNETPEKDDVGHKWSLSALTKHLESVGIDMSLLWARIYDLIIKTIISLDPLVPTATKKLGLHRCNCFDLFGFDVIVDSNLKPWLLEVNLSPSLGIDSPLDLAIKGQLLADVFTLIGVHTYDRKKESVNRARSRVTSTQSRKSSSLPPSSNHDRSLQAQPSPETFPTTLRFKQILKETIEENNRKGRFLRVFPAPGSISYSRYFEVQRTTNLCVYEALFGGVGGGTPLWERMKEQRTQSRKIVRTAAKKGEGACQRCGAVGGQSGSGCSKCHPLTLTPTPPPTKIKVSSDDILLEYVFRLSHTLRSLPESSLKPLWKQSLDRFLSHHAWLSPDIRRSATSLRLHDRLESRIAEIRHRKSQQAEGLHPDPESEFKSAAIRKLTSAKLESVLRTSVRNSSFDLVACLFDPEGWGLLTTILKWLSEDKSQRPLRDFPTATGE